MTNGLIGQFGEPETNEHLKREFMRNRKYRDVLVENSAFDKDGELINDQNCRAVYVRY